MRNITTPAKAVSFEDALRNLAAKLTGKPAASLPRTQEAVVQYIADTLPSVDALAEAITKEVLARMAAVEPPTSADGSSGGTDTQEPAETDTEADTADTEPPKGRKRKTKTE